jgi:microtubule-associated protein-like 6
MAFAPPSHPPGRYNLDHTDDVISLAIHPSGEFVATGEMGAVPKIVVWNSTDRVGFMDAVSVIKGFHRRAVLQLAFSPDGKYLASVGQDDDHSVAVWDWRAKTKVYSDRSDKVGGWMVGGGGVWDG